MKKTLLTLTVLLGLTSTIAQNEVKNEPANGYITLDAMSTVFYFNPRLTFGYIKPLNKTIALGLQLGYGNNNTSIFLAKESSHIGENYNLFEIRPEVFYFFNTVSRQKNYFSAELFYIHHNDVFVNTTYNDENDLIIRYDQADYKRIKTGITVNYGFIYSFSKRLGVNMKAGFGLRNRNVSYSNEINPSVINFNDNPVLNLFQYQENTGNYLGLELAFSVKLSYKL